MKKILITHELPSGRGGLEFVVSRIADMLKEHAQHDVEFALFDNGDDCSLRWLDGHRTTIFKSTCRNKKLRRLIFAHKLSKKMASFRPDIILCLAPISCFISRYAIKLTIFGKKPKLVSWVHIPPKKTHKCKYLALADNHLAICEEINKQLVTIAAKQQKVFTVYNPVSQQDTLIERNPNTVEFLYVGRIQFSDQKVLKNLLDSIAGLQGNFHLHVIGDGFERSLCEEYASQIGVNHKITWHGWKENPWDYIQDAIKTAHALILSSAYEGFPLVLLEAMARGIFCISSDCICGPNEIINNGINGILYEPGNVEQLKTAMKRVIEGEALPDHKHIKDGVQKFHDEKFIENFISVLNSIG